MTCDGKTIGDIIGGLVLAQYKRLPKKGRPLVRSNGVKEWTVLAGVVLQRGDCFECVALATGVKAMPDSIVAVASGKVVHDMHAEILVMRGLNLFLLDECAKLARQGHSEYVECAGTRFQLQYGVKVHLYVSDAPCGDASMSLFSGEAWQDTVPAELLIRGRNHFNALGYLRTKPGRADSDMTMSKSCSDKLALKQHNGVLLGPVAKLFRGPVFLETLVSPVVLADYARAFGRWDSPHPISFAPTDTTFPDSQLHGDAPSPASILWVPGRQEVLVNGVRQGCKVLLGKGVSCVSRWSLTQEVQRVLNAMDSSFNSTNAAGAAGAPGAYIQWKARPKFYPPGWSKTSPDNFDVRALSN